MIYFRVDNKLAIVTGCNKGIGMDIAVALAENGADIIGVSSKMKASGQAVEKAVTALGRKFYMIQYILGSSFTTRKVPKNSSFEKSKNKLFGVFRLF